MEKEKRARTTRAKTTSKTSAKKQSTAAETVEPKEPAARKKAAPVVIDANGAKPERATGPKKTSAAASAKPISREEIARLAHRYWAERGHQHGHHVEDWLRAERELLGKAS